MQRIYPHLIILLLCIFSVLSAKAVTLSVNTVNPTCANCNGSITLSATNGTPVYMYSINGGVSWSTNSNYTNRCAGAYTCIVKDALNNTDTVVVNLTGPSPLVFTAYGVNASNSSTCDGQIYVTITGGTPPYNVTLTGPSGNIPFTTSPVTGLCVGTYTLTVTDSATCPAHYGTGSGATGSAIISIGTGGGTTSPLNISVSTNFVQCTNPCNYIYATGSGGIPPYQYNFGSGWTTSSTSTCLMGAPGLQTFNVCVKDAMGSTVCTTIYVNWPVYNTLINYSWVHPHCGACDGSITILSYFGTGTMYGINPGGIYGTNPTFSNLCPGTYTVSVVPPNSSGYCPVMINVTLINQSAVLGVSAAVTSATCNANCNGSATITATGTGPFEYSINGGLTWVSSNVFSGLCAGIYTVQVRNLSHTCSGSTTFTITQPPVFSTSVVINTPSCNGSCNASIVASSSPSGTYQYSLNGGVTWQGSGTFSSLCAGTYTVTTKNSNGCILTQTYTITQPAVLSLASQTVNNPSCTAANNGSISIVASGGTPAYSYNWTPGNPTGDGTPNVSNLAANTWSCSITDSRGCNITRTFALTAPAPPTLSVTSFTNVNCYGGNTGTASVTASGGNGNYSYNWTPGNPPGDGTNSVTGLSAGTWTCTVTDGAAACSATVTVTITQPGQVLFSTLSQTQHITCFGAHNGSATVNASGGTGSYSYAWSPSGGNNANATNLGPGTYSCSITDAAGCTITQTVLITEPPALNVNISSFTNVNCNGNGNGTAAVLASGGNGNYTYDWSPGNPAGDGTNTISALNPGTYTSLVTDMNGCSASASVAITEPPVLHLDSVHSTNIHCYGNSNGNATVYVSGGNGSYNYNWLPSGGNSATASNLSANSYTCTITDSQGCTVSASTILTQPAEIQASASIVSPVCFGICIGQINVAVSPPGNYSYSFDSGNSWQPNNSLTGLCNGIFSAIVKDSSGCTDTLFNLQIIQPAELIGSVAVSQTSCGLCNGSASASASGGNPGYNYAFLHNSTVIQPNQLCGGNYLCIATDATGCQDSVQFAVNPSFVLQIDSVHSTDLHCYQSNDGSATVFISGGNGSYNYNWLPSGGNTATASNLSPGSYTCTITDSQGCTVSASTTLTQPSEIQATASIVSPLCYSICTGHIDIAVSPSGNYIYSFDFGNSWQQNNSLTGLCDGVFAAIVKNSDGCTDTIFNLQVIEPDELIGTVTVSQTSCGLCNGSAVANATGGSPGYNYLYLNNTTPMQPNQLCAGSYSSIAIDSNGCRDTVQFIINPSVNIQIDSVTAVGTPSNLSNGSATVYAQGNGFISFVWDNNQTGSTAINLNAGYYCVTATDSTGCTDSACVFVPVITDAGSLFASAGLQIYPNPFSDQLFIYGTGTWHFYLENMLGETVADFGSLQISSNSSVAVPGEIANGIYLLKAVSENAVYSARLIRQR